MYGSPKCSCGRKLRKVRLQENAVEIFQRTCPKCKIRWQVKVEPLPPSPKVKGMWVHILNLVDLDAGKTIAKLEAEKVKSHMDSCWTLWPSSGDWTKELDEPDFFEESKPCELCREYIHALRKKRGFPKSKASW